MGQGKINQIKDILDTIQLETKQPWFKYAYFNFFGYVFSGKCIFDTAIAYYRMAMEISDKTVGKNNLTTAYIYRRIGLVYLD